MAEKKQYQITGIGAWEGPITNGKYTNFQCRGKAKNEKGESEVMIQVGSKGMTERMQVGQSYLGRAVFKDDSSGLWVISFMAGDNPSLAAPQHDNGYRGGGGGGHKGGPRGGNESFALSYAKDIIVALIGRMPDDDPYSANVAASDALCMAEQFMPFLDGKHRATNESAAGPVDDPEDIPF